MTAPKTAPKSTPQKTSPAPQSDEVKSEVTSEVSEKETPKSRIPSLLENNSILGDFCKQYLDIHDRIASYNKEVLAERDSEWNATKVLEKARQLGRPTDNSVKPNDEIKKALTDWEDLINQVARARKNVLDLTAKEIGITLSATADRNPELEAPLKEERKRANVIGEQLSTIAKMTSDKNATDAVLEFLAAYPLPAIGRDQVRTFGNDGSATPKYRVTVEVSKNGEVLVSESGFTKAGLALTKPALGYERGKAPNSGDLREAWEKAGNTADKTVTNPVEFDDNGLHFKITKK